MQNAGIIGAYSSTIFNTPNYLATIAILHVNGIQQYKRVTSPKCLCYVATQEWKDQYTLIEQSVHYV